MSVNKHQPHVLVLPEDDANRQIANGFMLDLLSRQIQVLDLAGGWIRVLDGFTEDHLARNDLGSYETIGLALAKDCREGTDAAWSHNLLRHNANEVRRLREQVRPILFS